MMGKPGQAKQRISKAKQRRHPFFINSAKLRRSDAYFKENYLPYELHDFDWEYWESFFSLQSEDTRHKQQEASSSSSVRENTVIEVQVDVQNQNTDTPSLRKPSSDRKIAEVHSSSRKKKTEVGHGDTSLQKSSSDEDVPGKRFFDWDFWDFEPFLHRVQRLYRAVFCRVWNRDSVRRHVVDEELGDPSLIDLRNCEPSNCNRKKRKSSKGKPLIERNSEPLPRLTSEESELQRDKTRLHFSKTEEHLRMVEMEMEDANPIILRRGGSGTRRSQLRRMISSESESESASNDSLVAGPPMLDFNEPLPNIHQNSEIHPSPVGGDVGLRGDLDAALANVGSNTSRENLQNVVSQLGLEIPLQSKSSCHSPQHLHSIQQQPCCRLHAAHNIAIESLDLDIYRVSCCSHNRRRGLSTRTSCSSLQN